MKSHLHNGFQKLRAHTETSLAYRAWRDLWISEHAQQIVNITKAWDPSGNFLFSWIIIICISPILRAWSVQISFAGNNTYALFTPQLAILSKVEVLQKLFLCFSMHDEHRQEEQVQSVHWCISKISSHHNERWHAGKDAQKQYIHLQPATVKAWSWALSCGCLCC